MSTRPNILLICTDQHRHDYLGYAGAAWLRTPNLDQLAERGTVFTHAYTNSPLCVPARCALATGLLPHRYAGLHNWSYISLRVPTFYQRLRDRGYWTGFVGKLDLVKPDEKCGPDGRLPIFDSLGFCDPCLASGSMLPVKTPETAYLWHMQRRGLLDAYNRDRLARCPAPGVVAVGHYGYPPLDMARAGLPVDWVALVSQDSPFAGDDHGDAFCGSKAVEWLDTVDASRPWFYQVNFCGPHDPFDPPAEYATKYRDAVVPEPIPPEYIGKPARIARRFMTDHRESIRFTRRQYSACIEHLDHQIGRMVETLRQRGMQDNTVIIFTADHGEMLGDFGLYTKCAAYEAAAHIPLLACGPGFPAGRRSEALVELMDLNPTCCELAGLPAQPDIDARSLVPLMQQRTVDDAFRDSAVMVEHNYAAVRTRRWKYVRTYNDVEELYDMQADPQERRNLIGDLTGQRVHTPLRWEMFRLLNQRMTEGKWTR